MQDFAGVASREQGMPTGQAVSGNTSPLLQRVRRFGPGRYSATAQERGHREREQAGRWHTLCCCCDELNGGSTVGRTRARAVEELVKSLCRASSSKRQCSTWRQGLFVLNLLCPLSAKAPQRLDVGLVF